jgi:DNA repair protein RadC
MVTKECVNRKRKTILYHGEDPRAKLILKGADSLSNAELIALLIQNGSKEISVIDLSKGLLEKSDFQLKQLARKSVNELSAIKGMSDTKASMLAAAFELGRRKESESIPDKQKITCSEDAAKILKPALSDLHTEHFYALLLNRQNIVIRAELISKGGVSATVVDARLIFKSAIESLASGIILCHNHPSGNLEPSDDDQRITEQMKAAGKLLDITVYDHLIVSHKGYFSFADSGLM